MHASLILVKHLTALIVLVYLLNFRFWVSPNAFCKILFHVLENLKFDIKSDNKHLPTVCYKEIQ